MEINRVLNDLLYSNNPNQKEALISFAKYLKTYSLNKETCRIYLKILNLNYEEVAEIIFENRNPESFFSIIEPSREIISTACEILILHKPRILFPKITLACLGIIQNAYKEPVSGFSIYPLKISDLQHVGKYLIAENQDISNLIKSILESIGYSTLRNYKEVMITSQDILDYYYDRKKNLEDIIPSTLLN